MPLYSPFWSAFEEPSDEHERDSSEETHTLTREEADHPPGYSAGLTVINMGTDKTSTREPSDQYLASGGRGVVPRTGIRASRTMTQTREEEDTLHAGSLGLSRSAMAKTQTSTRTREEPDQDQSARALRRIPRIDQVHA